MRWLLAVTLAEAIGFLAPALTGILSARAGLSDRSQALLLVLAGAVEGFVLGAGQAWAWPLPVHRLRYAALTALGAAAVWAIAMLIVQPVASSDASVALKTAVLLVAGLAGLLMIGAAQALELRRHTAHAARWIGWTALAWALALPLSFLPAPLVDESTALAVHVVLWGGAGLLMAFTMACITWQGARRM